MSPRLAVIYKISTKNLGDDRLGIRRAISHIHTNCGSVGAYSIGEPTESMGWSFFELALDDTLETAVTEKFADMIQRYRGKDTEKFDIFISDYASARGCNVKMQRIS